jgi:DNA-binding beta-propeller fold protein YncE
MSWRPAAVATLACCALGACGDNLPATPDGGIPDPDPCVPEAPSVIAPVWTAGAEGTQGQVGRFGKADALLLDPSGVLLVGIEDFQEMALFDVDAVADGVAPPIADVSGWQSIAGMSLEPSTGRLFVVELAADRVRVMDLADDPRQAPYLTQVATFGTPAADPDAPGPGEFVRAQTVEFDSQGRIYVSDDGKEDGATGARDVQVFAPDFSYLSRFGRGDLQEPENFVIDEARGRIYVADEGAGDIVVFRFDDHNVEARFGEFDGIPNGIDVDQDGTIYVMDEGAGQVILFDPTTLQEIYRFGASSEKEDLTPGTFNSPDTLVVDQARGLVLTTDQGHHRIQAFDLNDVRARACTAPLEVAVLAPPRVRLGSRFTVQVSLERGGRPVRLPLRGARARIDGELVDLTAGTGGRALTAEALGVRTIEIEAGGVTTSVEVEVVDPAARALTGALTGAALSWSPDDGVITLTGAATVAAGETLSIAPGTLVAMGPGATLTIEGDLDARGTAAAPISIFAADPAAEWDTIAHVGGTATYEHVRFSGGGSGDSLGHCCTPMLRGDGTTLALRHVMFSDTYAKALYARLGDVEITDSVFARIEMGVEIGRSDHTTVTDSVFTTFTGPAGGDNDNDGLYFHEEGGYTVARCVFADATDDLLDLEYASAVLTDVIFLGAEDKAVSINGGHAAFTNALFADSLIGLGLKDDRALEPATPTCTRCTLAGNGTGLAISQRNNAPSVIEPVFTDSIVWANQADITTAFTFPEITLDHCVIADPLGTTATSTLSEDPRLRDPATADYRLADGSPAATASTTGGPVGWAPF